LITIIGVGHVFAIRDRLKEEIHRAKPQVVCVELDPMRLEALLAERRMREAGASTRRGIDLRMIGRGGLIFAFIAWTQSRLAKTYGSTVGDEMIAALEAARETGARAEFIDMESATFFRNWMSRLTRRERLKLFLSVFTGIFASRKRVEKELQQFYQDEDAFIRELAIEFPQTKRALIDERNEHMARGILIAQRAAQSVVAVVGEGHVAGIREELVRGGGDPQAIHVITLRELQGTAGAPAPETAPRASPSPGPSVSQPPP
jgi:pheromone shutdown protein TraB